MWHGSRRGIRDQAGPVIDLCASRSKARNTRLSSGSSSSGITSFLQTLGIARAGSRYVSRGPDLHVWGHSPWGRRSVDLVAGVQSYQVHLCGDDKPIEQWTNAERTAALSLVFAVVSQAIWQLPEPHQEALRCP